MVWKESDEGMNTHDPLPVATIVLSVKVGEACEETRIEIPLGEWEQWMARPTGVFRTMFEHLARRMALKLVDRLRT